MNADERKSAVIIAGKKAEALAAIAAREDAKLLRALWANGDLAGDWRRAAALKRMEELEALAECAREAGEKMEDEA